MWVKGCLTKSWPQTFHQLALDLSSAGPSPNPSPAGRGVVCEVTPTGLLVWDVGSLFSYAGETFLSQKTFFSLMVDILFSHRTHRFNRTYLRTVSNSQKASGIQISQNVIAKGGCWVMGVRCWWLAIGVSRWLRPSLLGRGRGRGLYLYGPLCVLFFCVLLWEKEHTHSMIQHTNNSVGSFFSHRAHRVHWAFLRTVSSSQKASGIQSSQSVTAKEGCWVMGVRCWWLVKDGWWLIGIGCNVLCYRLT